MEDSIFTKIINGEIPAHKIYEDDQVVAFLDINPFTPGHTLVVPRQQTDHIWDLDDELYNHLLSVAKDVANRQRAVLHPPRVAMQVLGNDVPHVHVHIFPLEGTLQQLTEDYFSKADKQAPDKELAEMAKKLQF